jgi:hypothetical protein
MFTIDRRILWREEEGKFTWVLAALLMETHLKYDEPDRLELLK